MLLLSACVGQISDEADNSGQIASALDGPDVVATFEEFNGGAELSSYAGIQWSSAAGGWVTWYDGYEPVLTMTAYVNNTAATEVTASFQLPADGVLKSLKVASVEDVPATVKISSPGNPERVWTGIRSAYQTLTLDWAVPASIVTVKITCASTYGAADVVFDDVTYGPVAGEPPPPDLEEAEGGLVWEPINLAQTRALRDSFDWSETTALSEAPVYDYTVDGQVLHLPAIHYVQIYVRNPDELRELEEIGIHYDMAPLFDSEWPDTEELLILQHQGDVDDGSGAFVFALMPAVTYNTLRAESLAGEDTYRAVILRDVPDEVAAPDGSVSWAFMLENMRSFAPPTFELTDEGDVVPPIVEEDAAGTSNKRLGRRLRQIARKVANVVRGARDLVRQAIGAAANLVTPDTVLNIQTSLPDRGRAPLVRAWDDGGDPLNPASAKGYGKRLQLRGMRIYAAGQSRLTMYEGKIDEHGRARIVVPRRLRVNICFEATTPAAKFEFGILRPVVYCTSPHRPKGASDNLTFELGGPEFYSMAQFIDARDYARHVLGFTPPQAHIQQGFLAELLTAGDAADAFVPCLAATNAPVSIVDAYAATLNLVPGAGWAVEFVFTTDIVMRARTQRSRNTTVHEYGHFLFCTLLEDTDPAAFDYVWSQVLTLRNFNGDAATPVKALNEGFADWFASQVVSSVNYFEPPGSVAESDGGNYFNDFRQPAVGGGMEANIGGPACAAPGCVDTSGWDAQERVVATVATLLHDVIDRDDCGMDMTCRDERRSDGAVWETMTTSFVAAQPFFLDHIGDEAIDLSPADVIDAVRLFAIQNAGFGGGGLSYANFYGALSDAMTALDHTEQEICQLFALHSPDGDCNGWPTGGVDYRNVGFRVELVPADPSNTAPVGTVTRTAPMEMECTASSCRVHRGGFITLRAAAQPGFFFRNWSGCSTATTQEITLTNVTADQECVANFGKQTAVIVFTVNASATGDGTVAPTTATVRSGDAHTLQATPNAGHRFVDWRGSPECTGTNPTLRIPAVTRNVTCTASFTPITFTVTAAAGPGGSAGPASTTVHQGGSVPLTATANTGYRFMNWSGSAQCAGTSPSLTISPVNGNVACTANFAAITPTVTATASVGGSVSPATRTVSYGGSAEINATASAGYQFVSWSGTTPGSTQCSGTSTRLVISPVTSDVSCRASFVRTFTVQATATAGGSVSPATRTVVEGGSAEINATPNVGYGFVNWTGSPQCSGTSTRLVISPVTSSVTCTANFAAVTYTVRATAGTGGSVSPATRTVGHGGSAQIDATPSAGYRFGSWSGSAQCTGTSTRLVISPVTSNVTCTANFAVATYTVRASATTGGTVSPATRTVSYNGSAQIDATPSAGYRFVNWSGSAQCTGTSARLIVSPVRSDVSCTANFARNQVTVSFPVFPSGGGTVGTSWAPLGSCGASSCTFAVGSSVTLTARANANYLFAGWSGCSSQVEPVLQLSNVTSNQTCTANFVRLHRVTYAADWPGSASAWVRFGTDCTGGVCTVIDGGGVDLTAEVYQFPWAVSRWVCTEAWTGRVLTSEANDYPEYFSLTSIRNDWSCRAEMYQGGVQ